MPKKQVHVPLNWHRIDWLPTDKWPSEILPRIHSKGIKTESLDRSVYVIRLNGNFCIEYAGGESPVVYIGEGNFRHRLSSHRKWAAELQELISGFSFQVCIATPRVTGSTIAYRDAEAALIDRFVDWYGMTPLWNKQLERRLCQHYEYSDQSMKEALNKRSGAKYQWSLRPMKSSPFHRHFREYS